MANLRWLVPLRNQQISKTDFVFSLLQLSRTSLCPGPCQSPDEHVGRCQLWGGTACGTCYTPTVAVQITRSSAHSKHWLPAYLALPRDFSMVATVTPQPRNLTQSAFTRCTKVRIHWIIAHSGVAATQRGQRREDEQTGTCYLECGSIFIYF